MYHHLPGLESMIDQDSQESGWHLSLSCVSLSLTILVPAILPHVKNDNMNNQLKMYNSSKLTFWGKLCMYSSVALRLLDVGAVSGS